MSRPTRDDAQRLHDANEMHLHDAEQAVQDIEARVHALRRQIAEMELESRTLTASLVGWRAAVETSRQLLAVFDEPIDEPDEALDFSDENIREVLRQTNSAVGLQSIVDTVAGPKERIGDATWERAYHRVRRVLARVSWAESSKDDPDIARGHYRFRRDKPSGARPPQPSLGDDMEAS